MTQPDPLADGRRPEYGFALALVELDGHARVVHGGATWGFTAALSYYPRQDVTIAVLTNRGGLGFVPVEKPIARAVLGIAEPTVKKLPLSAPERHRYVGTYDTYAFKMGIVEDGDRLRVHVEGLGPPSSPLLFQGDGVFVAETDPDTMRLAFDTRGERADAFRLEFAGMRWYATRGE